MEEIDLEDMQILRSRLRKGDQSVEARRAKETRVMPYKDRRAMQKSARTAQTNLKFTPATKQRLLALAKNAGLDMVEYVEMAIELKAKYDAGLA